MLVVTEKFNLSEVPYENREYALSDALNIGKYNDPISPPCEMMDVAEALRVAAVDPGLIWFSTNTIGVYELARILAADVSELRDVLEDHDQLILPGDRLMLPWNWGLKTAIEILETSCRAWAKDGISDYGEGDTPCDPETAVRDWHAANKGDFWFS